MHEKPLAHAIGTSVFLLLHRGEASPTHALKAEVMNEATKGMPDISLDLEPCL